MAQVSNAGSGWQSASSVIRVRMSVQPHIGLSWSSAAHSALQGPPSAGVRLVEVEQDADLLLIVGTVEWAERFIRQSRGAGDPTPILVLNGSAAIKANAQILDAGADDCLACPFDSAELLARVRAVTRRLRNGRSCGIEIAADREMLRIRLRDVEARVSRRQFDVFVCLAERRERWVHSDEIIATVSGTHHEAEASLVRVHIHGLRKALREAGECIRSDGRKRYMLSFTAP
jgi:DNA-binding response OmpR family regulator